MLSKSRVILAEAMISLLLATATCGLALAQPDSAADDGPIDSPESPSQPLIEPVPITPDEGAAETSREPPTRSPGSTPPPSVARGRMRLAGLPNMYGDFIMPVGQIDASYTSVFSVRSDNPLAGGGRRSKVSENNKALPADRAYFTYNHFHNARTVDPDFTDIIDPGPSIDSPVDQYTVGLEKTLWGDDWSIDFRIPFVNSFEVGDPSGYSMAGGNVGNLTITMKRLWCQTACSALSVGIGVNVPTGDDVIGTTDLADFTVKNEAVHLLPFIAYLSAPNDRVFFHSFLQLDIAANGNQIVVTDPFDTGSPSDLGDLTEQNLLHLDVGAGRWLYRNCCGRRLTGLASIVELHYTTALQDADLLSETNGSAELTFTNFVNRFDLLNLTVGLHAEIARCTAIRVGGVFPLRDEFDRFFDSEVQVQLNRRF